MKDRAYKPGDDPPTGYIPWHAWAEVQSKAGLRQKRCCMCCRFKFPQELSRKMVESECFASDGTRHVEQSPVCKSCAVT